ncbi:hypothetical protein J132_07325 [Termitomyces sp. J132]|nr:hypothetical protein H2248_001515 [Termitomyces sp. 'cryptogamus']KNZ71730.1 hypothetical protein J132_07325 [Termitomyces sp. J132]
MPSQPQRAPNGRFTRATPRPDTPPAMYNTLATSSDPNAPVSQEAFNVLQHSHTELHSMLRDLLMRVPLPAASLSASHAPDPTAAVTSAFVPPIPGAGVNGTSTFTAPFSLRTRFPDVEAAVIGAIILHEFKAAHLHKLDSMNCDKENTRSTARPISSR